MKQFLILLIVSVLFVGCYNTYEELNTCDCVDSGECDAGEDTETDSHYDYCTGQAINLAPGPDDFCGFMLFNCPNWLEQHQCEEQVGYCIGNATLTNYLCEEE
jgi:hypothetical protein